MKKLIKIAALISSCSLLCACGTNMLSPKLPDLDKSLAFSAEVSVNDTLYCADFERKGTDSWLISFSSPFSVGGMSLEVNGANALAAYDGVETKLDVTDFEKSPLCAVISSVEEAASNPNGVTASAAQEGVVAQGKAGDLDFTLKLNENGAPVALEINAIGLFAAISSFEITGEPVRLDVVGVY